MSLTTRGSLNTLILAGILHFLSFTAHAQSDPTGTKRVTDTYAITDATVFISPGNSGIATIIIKNGLIEEVGTHPNIPINAQVIKGDSLFVYAGFIDIAAQTGVGKPPTPEKPDNFDPSAPPPPIAGITPYIEVLDHFDPASEEMEKWRRKGFAIAQLIPQGDGMLTGKSAVVIYGKQGRPHILANSTGLSAKFQAIRGLYPGTTLGVMAKWRNLYKNAELAIHHQALFEENPGVTRPEKNPVLESFFPVIHKNIPVIFEVSDELQIRRALNLQKEKGFNLILTGINEGEALIPMIMEANAKVALSLCLPEDQGSKQELEGASDEIKENINRVKEAYTEILRLAAAYEKAGVPFAFGTQSVESQDFMKNIRLMIDHGLSEEAALAALTINAAKMLGLDRISGSIENGKLANLVITTDSLFKKNTQIKQVFVDGHLFDYETKQPKEEEKKEEEPIIGAWDYTTEIPEGSSSGVMTFKKESGKYQGTISFDDPKGGGIKTTAMRDIKWSGNTLEFKFNVEVKDMLISVTVSGEVSDNEYKGKMSITDFGSFPFNAIKVPESTTNL